MSKKYRNSRVPFDDKFVNSRFDFCKNLKWFLIAPAVIILTGLIILCAIGFNLGIDFTGGSTMTIYVDKDGHYGEQYDIKNLNKIEGAVQAVLDEHGLKITTIQTTTMDVETLGIEKGDAVIVKYQNNNKLSTDEITEINDDIRAALRTKFGYNDEGEEKLVEYGGVTTASASAELMMKSFIALLVAVVLILVYVAFRFELTAGLAAILALFHDVLLTASVVLICRVQINVSFIAALITILGYSINNTIIIFDRMRNDLKAARAANERIDNNKVANEAVKGTMLRSILTGITTFIMILMITLIGVADIREFAFPIMIGILAGFYSSVFITPGLWAIAYKPKRRKKISKSEVVEAETEEN